MQNPVVVEPFDFSCAPDFAREASEEDGPLFTEQGYIRPELLGYDNAGTGTCPTPSEETLDRLWNAFRKESGKDKRVPIELPPESVEENSGLPPDLGFWELLEGWAYHHRVDPDLALLICASATAHASGGGRGLFTESRGVYSYEVPPTLVADRKDGGFLGAVMAVVEPLRAISKELEARYEPLRKKSYKSNRLERMMATLSLERQLVLQLTVITSYPHLESQGNVRFVVEGKFTDTTVRQLLRCHHHTAMCVGEIEELPRSQRAKEERDSVVSGIIYGYDYGRYAIRGFLRFSSEDLDWLFTEGTGLRWSALPVRNQIRKRPVGLVDVKQAKAGFDLIYLRTVRHILRLRFDDQKLAIGFEDKQAAAHYRELWETHRKICEGALHDRLRSGVLFELLVWYLLHLSSASGVRVEPMEIVVRSYEIARRLQYRSAEILDEYEVLCVGRRKRKQVRRVLERMLRLGRPSTLRDLVRGFNKQQVATVRPLVDFLIEHRVFVCHDQKYEAVWDAREVFDRIPVERFAPPPKECHRSSVAQLERAEQWLAREAAAQSTAPISPPTMS